MIKKTGPNNKGINESKEEEVKYISDSKDLFNPDSVDESKIF